MNQRIKEIAVQAGSTHKQSLGVYQFYGFELEKFAKLIVKECMAMCKTAVGNADYNTGRLHCLEDIKDHFGVEE